MSEGPGLRGRVTVRLKPGVLDVEGKAVAGALHGLGFADVDVRVGKVFEVDLPGRDVVAARARLTEMAERLLANPVMESFTVEIEEVLR